LSVEPRRPRGMEEVVGKIELQADQIPE
jgi:hypothetical protein